MQTLITAACMVYELAKHPEVQEKVREQVMSVLGESGEPNMDALQKMPYLMHVIKETQRYFMICIYMYPSSLPAFQGYSVCISIFCSNFLYNSKFVNGAAM